MAWRIHLSERPIRRIDMLPGKPSILSAWTGADQVTFLDLQTGAKRGEKTLDKIDPTERTTETWSAFMDGLTASNGVYLPSVRAGSATILTTPDGTIRLIRVGTRALFHVNKGIETVLPIDENVQTFAAVDMDRTLGLVAALDDAGKLHLYQQNVKIMTIDTGLVIEPEQRPDVAVVNNGASIFVTDGKQIIAYGANGTLRRRIELYYSFGAIRASADGKLLVITDLDANVIRIYNGDTLTPTHQRFGVDLLADAKRVQVTPGPTTPSGALGALAVNTRGVVAFSVGGSLCVTNLARFKPLPGIAPVEEDEEDLKALDNAASFFPEKPSDAQTTVNS